MFWLDTPIHFVNFMTFRLLSDAITINSVTKIIIKTISLLPIYKDMN